MNEIEEIKSKVNIVDFIGEYVRLVRSGSGYKGLCPFHNEKTPSFTVSEERQGFHCFGCQKGGDIFTFLMEMEGLDFRDALEMLAERTGTELRKKENSFVAISSERSVDPKRLFLLLDFATAFYEKQLYEGQGKFHARGYLSERGMSEEILKKFRIGFAPAGWNNIENFLVSRGFSLEEIEESGLLIKKEENVGRSSIRRYDRFRERIMFPIMDSLGRIIGYSGRVLPDSDDQGAKYINTPETLIYHKSKAVYGLFQSKEAIKQKKNVIVVEGNMDVLAMHKSGFENTIAVSGTALTNEHLNILKRYAREIYFFFDMDDAGQEASRKSVEMANQLDIPSCVIAISGGKDAADMAIEHTKELSQFIAGAVPSMEYFLNSWSLKENMNDAQGKRRFAEKALSMIFTMQNEIEISHWMSRLSDRLGVEINALYAMLKKRQKDERVYGKKEEKNFSDESRSFGSRSRTDILGEKIASFLFFHKKLWEKYAQEFEEKTNRMKNITPGTFLFEVLFRARDSLYDFDSFRLIIPDTIRKMAEKAQHDMEVQIGQTGNISQTDAQKEIEYILEEIQKEYLKQQSKRVQERLSEAEKSGNFQEIAQLGKEMTNLMMQIHKK